MTNSNTNATGSTPTVWRHPWYIALEKQESTTTSDVPLMLNPKSETTGQTCTKCGKFKPLSEFPKRDGPTRKPRRVCNDCRKKHDKAIRDLKKAHPKPEPGPCPICGAHTEVWVLDHNHETMAFRGYICKHCNAGLGLLKDSPSIVSNALKYLNSETTD